MHKAVLKAIVGRAFGLLDIAVDAIRYAYSVASKGGEGALDEVDAAVNKLHECVNAAIDQL